MILLIWVFIILRYTFALKFVLKLPLLPNILETNTMKIVGGRWQNENNWFEVWNLSKNPLLRTKIFQDQPPNNRGHLAKRLSYPKLLVSVEIINGPVIKEYNARMRFRTNLFVPYWVSIAVWTIISL